MKKNHIQSKFIILLIFVVFALVIFFGAILFKNNSTATLTQEDTQITNTVDNGEIKTYPTLGFTIVLPTSFASELKYTTITLSSKKGTIIISRIGTNFSNLKNHLADLNKKNSVSVISESDLLIDNKQAIVRKIKYPGKTDNPEKAYNILVNNFVYSFSSKDEALFSDLDQIAQSFKYTP